MSFVPRGLYAVVDGPDEGLVAKLVEGGASVIQLRMKKAGSAELVEAARTLRRWTARAGVRFVVNDRVDVALLVGADGVHLGQDDLPIAEARAASAGRLVIGVSTHDVAQARAAGLAGADYLGFGPVYATSTKENPDPVQGISALAEAVRAAAPRPVVAIGGVTPERAGELAAAGASAACAISAVNGASDVVAAARRIAAAFAALAVVTVVGALGGCDEKKTAPPGADPIPTTPAAAPRQEPAHDPAVDDLFVDFMVQLGTAIREAGGDCDKLGVQLELFEKGEQNLIDRVRRQSERMTPDEKMAMDRRIRPRVERVRPTILPAIRKCAAEPRVQHFAQWFLR